MDEERIEKDFELDLNEAPFNPKQDKSGLIKAILLGVGILILIVGYFYITSDH